MQKFSLNRWLAAPLAAAAIIGGLTMGSTARPSFAFPPPPPTRQGENFTAVEGKVDRITTAPKGEVDGVLLDDGTWVHWPPHLQEAYAPLAKPGSRIRATGRAEINRKGEEWFETFDLTNLDTQATYQREHAGPPPKGPHGHRERTAVRSIEGTVQRFTTAPKGEIDGAILDNGAVIHWPPHRQEEFAHIAAVGDRVRVTGKTERTPHGDEHFEVASLQNSDANPGDKTNRPVRSLHPSSQEDARLQRLEDRLERIEKQLSELLERRS